MRAAIVMLLLAGSLAAEEIEWTRAERGELLAKSELRGAFRLTLPDDSTIRTDAKQVVALSTAYKLLVEARTAFEAGDAPSRMPVLLRVAPQVPWRHVQLVLQLAERARCPNVWYEVSPDGRQRRYVSARIPVSEPEDLTVNQYQVWLNARLSTTRRRSGGDTVMQIQTVYFRGAGLPVTDPRAARTVVDAYVKQKQSEDKEARFRGALLPADSVPFQFVVQGLELFDRRLFRVVLVPRPEPLKIWENYARQLPFPDNVAPALARLGWLRIGEDSGADGIEKEARAWGDGALVDPGIRLPLVPDASTEPGTANEQRLVINLTRHGEIRAGGYERSLRNLRHWLAEKVVLGSGQDHPRVLLRLDGRAPWSHAVALLQELEANRFPQVELAVRRRADSADSVADAKRFRVPFDAERAPNDPQVAGYIPIVLRGGPAEAPEVIRLEARRMAASGWGPASSRVEITHPTYVRMRFARGEDVHLPALLRRVGSAKPRHLQAGRTIDLAVSEKVPCAYPVAVLGYLRGLQVVQIRYFPSGHAVAAGEWSAMHLRYPKANAILGPE